MSLTEQQKDMLCLKKDLISVQNLEVSTFTDYSAKLELEYGILIAIEKLEDQGVVCYH